MSIPAAIAAFTNRSARRHERLQLLLYSVGLTALLVFLAAWIVHRADAPPGGFCYYGECPRPLGWHILELADLFALGVLALGLFVIAPASVAASVASERRAGTLDQLRTTPLSPLSLAAGFVLGAPARIYLLLAGPFALHAACALLGGVRLDVFVSTSCLLALGGIASILFGLVAALASRQEGSSAQAALAVALVLGAMGLVAASSAHAAEPAAFVFLHPAGAGAASLLEHDGLFRRLTTSSWNIERFDRPAYALRLAISPALSCLSSLVLALVLGAAACRKLAAPHLPLLAKKHALVLFAGLALAIIAPLRDVAGHAIEIVPVTLVLSLVMLPVVMILGLLVTPGFETWAVALRRGQRPRFWQDAAAPHAAVWLMELTLVCLAVLILGGKARDVDVREHYLIAAAWTGLVAATLPFYLQFLSTRYATATARGACGAAVVVFLMLQVIAIALVVDRVHNLQVAFVQGSAIAGVLVPAWVVLCQRALRRRTLAAAS